MEQLQGEESNVGRRRENRKLTQEEKQVKKEAILAALAKASNESRLLEGSINAATLDSNDYYTLSRDEMEALIYGDMEKLENWVNNMDKSHATRLLRWLIKERW